MHFPIRRILITAFCQTPGLASAMKLLFPGVEIYSRTSLEKKGATVEEVAHLLAQIDVWINVEAGQEYFSGGAFAQSHRNLTYLSIPLITFPAFHPDLCSASGDGGRIEYTSALAVWAYKTGMSPDEGAKLFNRLTFANLGYLSEWERSVSGLRAAFMASGLSDDFDRFFRRIKRLGLFMYTASHPRPAVLAALAKLIAVRLGRDQSVLEIDLPVYDALSYLIWPVYPEIAETFSLPTSGYVWQWSEGPCIRDLGPFVAHSYAQYKAKGIGPDEIKIPDFDLTRFGNAVVAR